MKKTIGITILLLLIMFSGCSKESASKKFVGRYNVSDAWSSGKMGSGNLDYEMMIVADGDDGILLMNLNKTFNGIKATISEDQITIPSQQVSSVSGAQYMVKGDTGNLKDNKLDLKFVYSDILYASAVGEVECKIAGSKLK